MPHRFRRNGSPCQSPDELLESSFITGINFAGIKIYGISNVANLSLRCRSWLSSQLRGIEWVCQDRAGRCL